ncbi:MAG TPA: hypothetical protein VGV39_20180 [Mesorhizobium sp.]|jgi:hypothetical protein|uniref:hypothetical protein n=1 Tax=Mesorhizobium sp. TaxID=1871066 RepID=UPI002DDCB78C|nr:hypothetical protein [Mesorhizobium sp.]HEV2505406.1 hypothetical protein [Mesorhizobium sp.]
MKPWKIVVAFLLVVAAFSVPSIVSRFSKPPAPTVEGIAAEAEKSGLTIFKALQEALPAESEKFMSGYLALAKEGRSAQETAAFIGKNLADIRRRHADALRKADPALVLTALQAKRDMLELVKANETPQDCGGWIVADTMTPAMQAKGATYALPADRFAAAAIRAMGAGEKSPVDIGAATADDWQAIATQYVAGGGALTDLQGLAAAGPQDPRACEMNQKLLKVLADAPGVSGQRIRAETVRVFVLAGSS